MWLKYYECWTKTLTLPCAFYFVVLCTCVDNLSWLKFLMHNIFWGDLGNMLLFSFYVYWTISLRNEEVGLHKVLVNFPPHGHMRQRSCGRSCCNFVVLLNAMMNNYWTMSTKYCDLSVASRSIIAEANNWSARHCLIEKCFDNLVQYLFFIIRSPSFVYINHSLMAHGSNLKFLVNNVVSITHEQNIIWRKTRLDGTRTLLPMSRPLL